MVEAHRQARREASVVAEAIEVVKEADSKQTSPVKYMSKEEQKARVDAGNLLRAAGYEFRLYGRYDYWTPQYRKDGGEWTNIPGVEKPILYPTYAEKALDEFELPLAAQVRQEHAEIRFLEAPERTCPGYAIREPGAKHDAVTQPVSVQDGFYTVSWADTHRTFRLQTNGTDSSFAPGKQLMAFLGKDVQYINFAFVSDGKLLPWKRFQQKSYDTIIEAARFLLTGDLASAGKMYAQQSGNCYRCGRVLTTPESLEAGIGPVCATRG